MIKTLHLADEEIEYVGTSNKTETECILKLNWNIDSLLTKFLIVSLEECEKKKLTINTFFKNIIVII